MSGAPSLTVLVATRNREAALAQLLEELAHQETGGRFTYDVLVIDNGSTDRTRQMIEARQARYPVPLTYVYEGIAGKPRAINAGIRQARGAVLAFTDDDIVPTPTWLLGLWRCFQEEAVDAVGGRILPRWLEGRPAWLTDQVLAKIGSLGIVNYGETRLRRDCRWVGGNFALRREVIERVGGLDVRMLRGEDTEYYQRCMRAGIRVCYEPSAVVYHHIKRDRTTPSYFRRWRHQSGYYHALLPPWRKAHVVTIMPPHWYPQAFRWAGQWVKALATCQPWGERFVCEVMLRDYASQWWHRAQLWPRWCLAVATGRTRRFLEADHA